MWILRLDFEGMQALDAALGERVAEPIGVIAFVGQEFLGFGQAATSAPRP